MTSKKRVESGDSEGEVEPKRPRGEEEEKQEHLEVESEITAGGQSSSAPQPQQQRRAGGGGRDWLSFSGHRHPRVGDEFQVAILPNPSNGKGEDDASPREKQQSKEE